VTKENMLGRARDELFSHINRCGVLQAEEDDQRHWMDETIDYLAERYPDLSDGDLQELSQPSMVEIWNCQYMMEMNLESRF